MSPRVPGFLGRHIVVADEDRVVVGLVIATLLADGHAVFYAYDGLSALQLALSLKGCDLVISNTRVGGVVGIDLIHCAHSTGAVYSGSAAWGGTLPPDLAQIVSGAIPGADEDVTPPRV